jgi:hypothetical protein
MDQIVSAVMAVLPAVAAATATSAIKDAYLAFKELVQRKWGEKGDVTKTLEALEKTPRSEDLAKDLERYVAACRLHEDDDIMFAIKRLTEALADKATAAAGPSVKFEQSGGKLIGVGAIASNTGNIRVG